MTMPSSRVVLSGLFLMSLIGVAGTVNAVEPTPVAPRFTPKLQQLFAEEMRLLLDASQKIIAAMIAGDDAGVAHQAQAIHDSFILDKKLTAQDRKDLESAVPAAFLELDAGFHRMAAKLAQAARNKDRDLENFYFSRMLESCQSCHRQYATDKFPAHAKPVPVGHSH